jgi:hypothetical protein
MRRSSGLDHVDSPWAEMDEPIDPTVSMDTFVEGPDTTRRLAAYFSALANICATEADEAEAAGNGSIEKASTTLGQDFLNISTRISIRAGEGFVAARAFLLFVHGSNEAGLLAKVPELLALFTKPDKEPEAPER